MSTTRRIALLALAVMAVTATTAASASAATFAPAGDGFQATAGPVTIKEPTFGGMVPGSIVCNSSSTSGTLGNPASWQAVTSVPSFAPSPCSMPAFQGAYSATVASNSPVTWYLEALSTSQVKLRSGAHQGLIIQIKNAGGSVVCNQYLSTLSGITGSWSNASHTLTFTDAPFSYTASGSNCASAFIPASGTVKLSGTYTFTDTTNPGASITVQP